MNSQSDDAWLQTLRDAARERYQAMHNIRERVHRTCLWTLGSFLVVTGWLVQRPTLLGWPERIFLLSALVAVRVVLRGGYLRDLEAGFRGQQRIAVKIEEALGLYNGIYPLEWQKAGQDASNGHFFSSSYALLYVGCGILVGALVFSQLISPVKEALLAL